MKVSTLLLGLTVLTHCVVLCDQGAPLKERYERAIIGKIVGAVVVKAFSFGVDFLLEEITKGEDVSQQLENIQTSLKTIMNMVQKSIHLLEDIKDRFAIEEASKIERDLLVFFNRYERIIAALRLLRNGTNEAENRKIMENIDGFQKDVTEIPNLLVKLHYVITGQSTSAGGRTDGLLCGFVSYSIRSQEAASSDDYNITKTMSDINEYRDNLFKFQVAAFQLRNSTCSEEEALTCGIERQQLEQHLQAQHAGLEQCVPQLYSVLAVNGMAENRRIVDTATNQNLYSQQTKSLVTSATLDHNKILTPLPQGLRCDSKDTFEFKKADGNSFYMMYENKNCYLSFDRRFIPFERLVKVVFTESDRIDREEFLICLKDPSPDGALFQLYATTNSRSTTYQIKEVETGKYLNVHSEMTSLDVEPAQRLVVTLLLDDEKSEGWRITQDTDDGECTVTSAAPRFEPRIVLGLVITLLGVVIKQ